MPTQAQIVLGLLGVLTILFALIAVVDIVHLVIYATERPQTDSTCPRDVCQTGMSINSGGVKHCQIYNATIGSTCDSACHVAGTATTCDTHQQCVNADPTTCLGACVPVEGWDIPILDFTEDCNGRLQFYDFFTWNTAVSSGMPYNWLYQSDQDGQCHAYFGCRWFANQLLVAYTTEFEPDFAPTFTGGELNCLDFLNMTNKECIQSWSLPLDENISTPLFQTIFAPIFEFDFSQFRFQSRMCMYWYKCGVVNTTALTDPSILLGEDKRSLSSAQRRPPQVHPYLNMTATIHARAEGIRKQLGPHLKALVRTRKGVSPV